MSSLFVGKTGLRLQYVSASHTDPTSAVDAASAFTLAVIRKESRVSLFLNGTGADLSICFVHPESDPSVTANRLFAFEVPASAAYNLDGAMGGLTLDVGTQILVFKSGGSTSAGQKLRLTLWG